MSSLSKSTFATRAEKLNALINELRSHGATTEVDVPTVCVIGNQSAGKSSLIEAIAGISLPRSENTCTRVPFEIRLVRSAEPWSGQVKLRFDLDADNVRLPQPKEFAFGPALTNPIDVECLLRRAQLAVLNPSVSMTKTKEFAELDLGDIGDPWRPLDSTEQLEFSRNVVILELKGKNLLDLTMIDLPGIVQYHESNKRLVDLVKDLVLSYITPANCIILLTITMRDDINNQAAVSLAKEVDEHGTRTIGCLTKPDVLSEGEAERQWLPLLRNEKHRLHHGYFVTKQPGPKQLEAGIQWGEARQAERDFFMTQPWSTLSGTEVARLGTNKLVPYVSQLLSKLIDTELPSIRDDINAKLAEIRAEQDSLPDAPSEDPLRELFGLVDGFHRDMSTVVHAAPHQKHLVQALKEVYEDFKTAVNSSLPRFAISQVSDSSKVSTETPAFLLDDGSLASGATSSTATFAESRSLDDVESLIKRSVGRELPFSVPFDAKAELIRETTVTWLPLVKAAFARIRPLVEKELDAKVDSRYGRYASAGLRQAVSAIALGQVEQLSLRTLQHLERRLEMEAHPFTLNLHYLETVRDKLLAHYKSIRHPSKGTRSSREEYEDEVLSNLASLGFEGVTVADLGRLRNDQYAEVLTVMAETRAYTQVAYKRLIDNVPQIIDAVLIRPLPDAIRGALLYELKLTDWDALARSRNWLSERPEDASRRAELAARRLRLEGCQTALRAFTLGEVAKTEGEW